MNKGILGSIENVEKLLKDKNSKKVITQVKSWNISRKNTTSKCRKLNKNDNSIEKKIVKKSNNNDNEIIIENDSFI